MCLLDGVFVEKLKSNVSDARAHHDHVTCIPISPSFVINGCRGSSYRIVVLLLGPFLMHTKDIDDYSAVLWMMMMMWSGHFDFHVLSLNSIQSNPLHWLLCDVLRTVDWIGSVMLQDFWFCCVCVFEWGKKSWSY